MSFELIASQLKPYHGIEYLEQAFNLAHQIQIGNKRTMRKFRILILLLLTQAAHFLYQYFRTFSPFEVVLHGDYALIANIKRELYWGMAATLVYSAFAYHMFFFKHDSYQILGILCKILIRRVDPIDFFRGCRQYRGRSICVHLRRYALMVLNILQIFITNIDILVVASQADALIELFRLEPDFYLTLSGLCALVFMEARLFLLYCSLYLFAYIHLLIASLWFALLEALRIKLHHLSRSPVSERFIQHRLTRTHREIIKTLLFILIISRFWSVILLMLLIVNIPLNCLLVAGLILDKVPLTKMFFVVFGALYQFIIIFLIHLMLADINKRFAHACKTHVMLSIKHGPRFSWRQKLRIDCFIQTFHARRRYGFTYTQAFGLITMLAFTKYLLLYSELIMFVATMT